MNDVKRDDDVNEEMGVVGGLDGVSGNGLEVGQHGWVLDERKIFFDLLKARGLCFYKSLKGCKQRNLSS